MIVDRYRYNDYEERLYSTGYDELDELLERAFCDGYEYAQREFGLTEFMRNRYARSAKAYRKLRDLHLGLITEKQRREPFTKKQFDEFIEKNPLDAIKVRECEDSAKYQVNSGQELFPKKK